MKHFDPRLLSRRYFLKAAGGAIAGLGAMPLLGWRGLHRGPRLPRGAQGESIASGASVSNTFVYAYSPASRDGIPLNEKVKVLFVESSEPRDHIDPDSISLLTNGREEYIYPYYNENRGNREFHFVPFPFWMPGVAYTLTIPSGVTFAVSGESMTEDMTWTFQTTGDAPDEDYDPVTTRPLTQEEIELAHAGSADRFLEENLVKDFMSPGSTLYDFSVSVDPGDPEVIALGEKMVDSLASLGAIGMAAPQIGINRRLFVAQISGRKTVFINPRVVDWSDELNYYTGKEGCLSIDYVKATVARPRWITVEYDTIDGDRAVDIYIQEDNAIVWLHEYDHLNGILMTDRQEDKRFPVASPARETGELVPITPRRF